MSLEGIAERAFAPVAEAVAAGRIPGAVLGLARPDRVTAIRWTGAAALVPGKRPLTGDTVFDLASLTKVMVTVPEVLRLVEEGRADLDDPLARHLPELRAEDPAAPVRQFTLRQALSHSTGLIAHEPIWTWGEGEAHLKAMVLARDWPVGEPVYSDINFILLGLVIERLRGMPIRALPVGDGLTFAPDPARTAATEDCPWRGRVLVGEVHDENAFALGGAAGHAGLFGTAVGVLGFARDLMAGRLLSPPAMAAMRRPHGATRTLGWERPFPNWTGGSLASPDTLGHTGFTGTGLWIDFSRGLAWTLLTNRVHPSRHADTGIQHLRRAVGNLVCSA
jgi:CubicO group peptidase (beta-lactamase class C family)